MSVVEVGLQQGTCKRKTPIVVVPEHGIYTGREHSLCKGIGFARLRALAVPLTFLYFSLGLGVMGWKYFLSPVVRVSRRVISKKNSQLFTIWKTVRIGGKTSKTTQPYMPQRDRYGLIRRHDDKRGIAVHQVRGGRCTVMRKRDILARVELEVAPESDVGDSGEPALSR